MTSANDIGSLWLEAVRSVLASEQRTKPCKDLYSIGSNFGTRERTTVEILATPLTLTNPQNRILTSQSRKIDYAYMLANFLFFIKGDDTIDFIDFYNQHGRKFCETGNKLGASYGYRIRYPRNQMESIKTLLKKDPSSRRAILQVTDREDIFKELRDFSCINYFQLLVRDDRLHMICNMRSQSAYNILPYDIFMFSLFQECMAVELGYELGSYIHFCGSLHIYDNEIEAAERALAANVQKSYIKMPEMLSYNDTVMENVFKAESDIRASILGGKTDSINFNNYNLDSYWSSYLETMIMCHLMPERAAEIIQQLGAFSPASGEGLIRARA